MADHNRDLEYYLKDAIRIEISTIPLYLFAMYSIKKDTKPENEARKTILTVVKQEMLHLALAGNLMAAAHDVGGPILYNEDYFPTYGGPNDKILKTNIPLILNRCEESTLQTFTQIEAPQPSSSSLVYIASEENSIGEFYGRLEKMIDDSSNLFNKNTAMQFPDSQKPYSSTHVNLTITSKETAKAALKVIVDQGEGGGGVINGHYQKFTQLSKDWTQKNCSSWNVKSNPSHNNYKGQSLIENLSDAFNAAYCYLLLAISKVWHTNEQQNLFDTYRSIMVEVLSPLADLLVSLPLSTGTANAAPTFERYIIGYDDPLGPSDIDSVARLLREKVKEHIKETKKISQSSVLDTVLSSIEHASWP